MSVVFVKFLTLRNSRPNSSYNAIGLMYADSIGTTPVCLQCVKTWTALKTLCGLVQ